MASLVYDGGSFGLQHRDIDWLNDTIEVILVKSTYTPSQTDTAAVYAANEISGVTGYTGGFAGSGRKVLSSKTLTNDTVNNRTVYNAGNPTAWTLGVGDTVAGAIVGKKGASDDTTAIPIFFLSFSPVPTNGSTFTLQWNASGISYTQQ